MQNSLIITAWKRVKWNTKILFCPNTTKKISRTLWNASYLCLLCLPFQVLPFPLVALLDLEHETSISKTSQNMVLYQAILISVWSLTLMVLILVTTRNSYNLRKLMLRQHTHTHTQERQQRGRPSLWNIWMPHRHTTCTHACAAVGTFCSNLRKWQQIWCWNSISCLDRSANKVWYTAWDWPSDLTSAAIEY